MLAVGQRVSAGAVRWVTASGCLSGLGRSWGGVGRRWWGECFQVSRAVRVVGRWKTMGRAGAVVAGWCRISNGDFSQVRAGLMWMPMVVDGWMVAGPQPLMDADVLVWRDVRTGLVFRVMRCAGMRLRRGKIYPPGAWQMNGSGRQKTRPTRSIPWPVAGTVRVRPVDVRGRCGNHLSRWRLRCSACRLFLFPILHLVIEPNVNSR